MPVAALCPSCGRRLSETTVVAGAPHCTGCGAWIVGINGTLGFTSAYGVGDSSLTRRRVEADLEVLREYQMRYTGMLEDCKQKLTWGAERYADLPQPPEFLPVQEIPYSKWRGYLGSLLSGSLIVCVLGIPIDYVWYHVFDHFEKYRRSLYVGPDGYTYHPRGMTFWGSWIPWEQPEVKFLFLVFCGCIAALVGGFLIDYYGVQAANGDRPLENVRRREVHETEMAAALRAGELNKAAEDHRLRVQIRELEGEVRSADEKAAEVRRILAAL